MGLPSPFSDISTALGAHYRFHHPPPLLYSLTIVTIVVGEDIVLFMAALYSRFVLAVDVWLGQNNGVRQVHQPRRTSSFFFGGYGRLIYAEAGDAVGERLVGRLSSCKRATVRTISGERAPATIMHTILGSKATAQKLTSYIARTRSHSVKI